MNKSQNFKDDFKSQYHSFFSDELILEALNQLHQFPIQISFIKESKNEQTDEKLLIASGIIKFQSGIDLRLTLKTKEDKPISVKSTCSCLNHTKKNHCAHVILLILKVTSQHKSLASDHSVQNGQKEQQLGGIDDYLLKSNIVTPPKEFGTLISNFKMNENSVTQNLQFQNLQYLLLNNKTVNFNNPKKLPNDFELLINLKTKIHISDDSERIIAIPYFSLVIDGELKKTISIFDIFYIFDFESGDVYHIPGPLRDFASKVLKSKIKFSIDELFNFVITFFKDLNVKIFLNDEEIDLKKIEEINQQYLTLTTTPSNKFTIVNYSIKQNESISLLPFISSLFALDAPIYQSFTKKIYAYNFLEKLTQAIPKGLSGHSVGPELRYSKKKHIFELYVHFLIHAPEQVIYTYHFPTMSFYKHSMKEILKLFATFYQYYGKSIFSNGTLSSNEDSLSLKCLTKTFYESFSSCYEEFEATPNVLFFIKKNQIRKYKKSFGVIRNPSGIDWFDISVKMSHEDIEFLDQVKDNTQIYEINNETVFLTKTQLHLIKFFKRNIDLKGKKRQLGDFTFNIKLKKHNIFELFSLHQEGILPALYEDELLFCQQISSMEELPQVPTPEIKGATLRNYQMNGLKWMHFLYQNGLGHCLADDMGLGKTLQTISLIELIWHQRPKILIVCPVSILLIWKNEFEKFTDLDVHVYYGADRQMIEDKPGSITITSYGILKNELLTTFKDVTFDLIIFDEAQNFKNPKSKATFAAKTVQGNVKITLTGTPLENDLSEFYNILDVGLPGVWSQYLKLRRKNDIDLINISKKIASPFILRRTKADVLKDLPPKNEQIMTLIFSNKEEENYKKELLKIKNKVFNKQKALKSGEVLNDILFLRKLCLWQKSGHIGDILSTKINFLKDTIEQITKEGHKSIIFSQFTEYLDFIEREFQNIQIPYARFDGTYSLKKREREIRKFEDDVPVILISLKAGGTGLNLNMASYVFLLDPWWNPAIEEQAIDRAYRMGKEFPLTVYKLVIKDSIEEKIINLQKTKKDLFDQVLNDNESIADFKFNLKEIENILFE